MPGRFGDWLAPARSVGPERLKLIGVITGGHFAVHWYMQIFSVILPSIKAGLGLSDVEVGALMTARQITEGTLNLPSGILADTLVRHRALILASSLCLMGGAYFLFGVSVGFFWVLLAAALVGLGTAVWHPAALGCLSARFPERRATAIAIHGMGANVSNTVTPIGMGALLVAFHWRPLLMLQLVPALLFALLVWRGLAQVFLQETRKGSGSSQIREIGQLAKNPVFLGIAAIRGLMRMGRLVILTFLPVYLQQHLGYSPFWVGFYLTMLFSMGIVAQPVMAVLSDRYGRKTVLFPSFMLLGCLYLSLIVVSPGLPLGLVIGGIGLFFHTLGNVTTAALLDVAGSRVPASSFGLASVMTQAVVLPTPLVAGFVIDAYGIFLAFVLSGAFLLMAGTLVGVLRLSSSS